MHAQSYPCAFQLSQGQVRQFAELGKEVNPDLSAAPCSVLPFLPPSNARYVTGEERRELRIYRQQYDLPPPFIGTNTRCVQRGDEDVLRQFLEMQKREE